MAIANPVSDQVEIARYARGQVGPSQPMQGPVADGGVIVAETAPGCWGPMITPHFRGGHECTLPVAVEGAEVGDGLVVRIERVEVTSLATASGTDGHIPTACKGDPYVAHLCPGCGTPWPETYVEGTGQQAIRCKNCGAPAGSFSMPHGYTMAFDGGAAIAVTLDRAGADRAAADPRGNSALPANSEQYSILTFAPADLPLVATRMRPFLGNIGTTPAVDMPDSHNAGDFGTSLVGAPHEYGLSAEDLERHRTDGHMDIDAVRAGAILICPVKVPGGGVYLGDMHAMQGDGEIAGHTADVSGRATLRVSVLKGLGNDGPILLMRPDDLPPLARPLSADERAAAEALARKWGASGVEESGPISFVGSGPNLNAATDNGLARAAATLGMSVDEVKNRATITGGIEIGRHPGVVTVTLLAPMAKLDAIGLGQLVREQYGL
ncbi:MAG TPA: acetamidase/formamidase family protein [Chloroflexaceae bacterium]|nr:acetamidase/formamidase family protein [Chloroflexaceae bacterium]